MGGKSSKENKKESQAQKQSPHASPPKPANLSSMSIKQYKETEVAQTEKAVGTLVKSNATNVKSASSAQIERQYLQSLVELLIGAEPVRALIDDLDENAVDLLSKNLKQIAFMKAFRGAIQNPSNQGKFIEEVISMLSSIIHESSSKKFDEACLLMLCLSTSFKVLRLPHGTSIEDERPITQGLAGILQNNWDDVENTPMQAPIQMLVEDLERLLKINYEGSDWNQRIENARQRLETVDPNNFTVENLKGFVGAIQNWIVVAPEELETDENWSLVLPPLRRAIVKAINGKYYDAACFSPRSLYMDDGILLNTFRLGQNTSFGTLSFSEKAFLSRYGRIYVQYYLEEKSVYTRAFSAAFDLSIKGNQVDFNSIKPYLPTMEDLINKLATLNTETDLRTDYDSVGVYLGPDKQFNLAYKNDLLFDSCQQGNESSLRVYFTRNTALFEEDTIKIILKTDTTFESYAKYNYLVLAKRSDTLDVIIDKINAVNNYETSNEQLSDSFKKHIMDKLIVSKYGILARGDEASTRAMTEKLQLRYEKSIGEVLDAVRGGGREKDKIDLVFYINIESQDFGGYFTPDNIDNEIEGNTQIPIKLELSKLFNLELFLAGFTEETVSTWTEGNIMEMLPNLLYVDIRNIQNIIEVPREASVDIFKQVIIDQSLPITNEYKAIGYLCKVEETGCYCIKVLPHTKGEVTATFNDQTQRSTIDQLNIKYIVGVLFERRLPDL